jgi:hypothetical protein
VYCTYNNVDQAINKLLIEALSDEIVGSANCTSLQIYERLNTPYDPNQPIETLFQQIQDLRAFAVAGGQPNGAAMIVNVAYTLVFNT